MEKEILACIKDQDIKYLQSGQISKYVFPLERKEAHDDNISHLIIRVFAYSISPKNEIKYLIQRRSVTRESFPGYFTDSASGHVIFKKNLSLRDIEQNAKRELQEEFGIQTRYVRETSFYDLRTESYKNTSEISYIFLFQVDHDVDLKADPIELDTETSKFYSETELRQILKQKNYVDYSRKIWEELLIMNLKELIENKKIIKQQGNIALFIGRFQPFHHGHVYVINNIIKDFKKIKIAIGSSQLSNTCINPFTSAERKKFLVAALKSRKIPTKNYEIFEIPDIFNAEKWVNHVVSIVGDFDAVFSNSDWIRILFQQKDFNIGKKITIFKKKYNGTNIRKLICKNDKNWRNLVPKEVIKIIEESSTDGINRIKKLCKEGVLN
ncbi:MAG: nicotinamide-nucleotide adenylyltransferase [Candidatus Lokiarchaeota archaeon]|nr:nicotinamide-nucleotide adenylyltransferase [Candidatus Lokiarchaeota archaeon]